MLFAFFKNDKFAFKNNLQKMKKATYTIIVLLAMASMFSCKKIYHCSCSYNNVVVYNADLGSQVQSNAQTQCSNYDTTIKGEAWTCTIY